MATGHDTGAGGDHGVGHVVPLKILVATGMALLALTAITVWAASIDFGAGNIFVAMIIAGVKASLVVLFFMHLFWDRPFHSFVFVTSICFVVLFIAFALTDSVEYQEEVIPGNAVDVDERLTQLSAP